ncbi:peptide transporter family 1-like [Ctenocephalides felis]|uniref:peptide transporter family 1-like n=1 Tax=Ctenocephalides felis TaxID=7515 RepID=UPI000E6E4F21|nr:peptide transporter family 1-like [Ctenocephalides felis]
MLQVSQSSRFHFQTTISSDAHNSEKNDAKLPKYPVAVYFVLGSKFFESFAANGVRTVLALYLRDSIGLSENTSTTVLHIFNFFSQFTPVFGAILADSYLGNSNTIFYTFFLYGLGYTILFLVTWPILTFKIVPTVFTALLLISLGNGGIRACVTSLGGSQFTLPQQTGALDDYFSHYYFVYTMGVLLSKIAPPAVRAGTSCFHMTDCYTAVFGLLAGAFLLAWAVFLFGLAYYRAQTPSGKHLCQTIRCHALVQNARGRKPSDAEHWLDSARSRYGRRFVGDVKAFIKVLVLFLPLPVYWSLTAQQDSTWTYQPPIGHRFGIHESRAGPGKSLGPILLLLLILFMSQLSILFDKLGILQTSLDQVRCGGIMAVLSFLSAGVLQKFIENNSSSRKYSVLWQIPQFLLLMLGEVLLSIPGLQFAFTQAPKSMKSVLTAFWFVNNALGNLIVVIITEINLIKLQSDEFFLYAGLMAIGITLFSMMASRYRMRQEEQMSIPIYKNTTPTEA